MMGNIVYDYCPICGQWWASYRFTQPNAIVCVNCTISPEALGRMDVEALRKSYRQYSLIQKAIPLFSPFPTSLAI